MKKTWKQQMIDELMEGTNFAYPETIRKKLNRKTTDVIQFYFNTSYRSGTTKSKERVIDFILHIG